jgi:uncharacterized protein (TIGR00725 family)
VTSYVAVIGAGDRATATECTTAEAVGRLLAERGCILVTGGLGGVMAAAARGAAAGGGVSVGLLPGRDRAGAAPDLTVAIPTGLGELRNGLVVRAVDGVVAVGGSWGTQSEIALAMRTGTPVVVVDGWAMTDASGNAVNLPRATSAAAAVDILLAAIHSGAS